MTIEDAAELQLNQRHVLRLEARPPNIEGEGAIPIRDLVRNSLRMRPDRIIVGECRGQEALDMLQAMNTGHDGVALDRARQRAARRARPHRDHGADGRLRPPDPGDSPAGLVGARHDRPHRADGGRLAPLHGGDRGAADGVRRDHRSRTSSSSRSTRSRPTARSTAGSSRPASGRSSSTSSRSAASTFRPALRSPPRPTNVADLAGESRAPLPRRRRAGGGGRGAGRRPRCCRRVRACRSSKAGTALFPDRAYVLTLPSARDSV